MRTQIACHNESGHVGPSAPPAAISLVSAGALAYEVLLTRLLSIVQWHHFAYMAISIALLGYGASGSFLALFQDRLRPHFTAVFALSAALFGVSAVAGFVVAQRLPFNGLAVIWEPRQLLYLMAYYLLFAALALPDKAAQAASAGLSATGTGVLSCPTFAWQLWLPSATR